MTVAGREAHQGLLEPELAGQLFPVLDAQDEFEALEQVVGDGLVVDAEEALPVLPAGCLQPQHVRPLHMLKRILLELLALHTRVMLSSYG